MAGSSLPSLAHGRVPPLRSVPRGICEIHRRSLAPLSRLGQHCVAQSTSPATFRSSAPSHFTLDADGGQRGGASIAVGASASTYCHPSVPFLPLFPPAGTHALRDEIPRLAVDRLY
jgi:hypothetical protein